MTRSDRVRRAVSLTLAVLCFLVVPQLAFGQFSSSKAPNLVVSAGTLVTPTAVTGTYKCTSGFFTEGAEVRVTGLTDSGQPNGVNYTYALLRGAQSLATVNEAGKQAFLSGTRGIDLSTVTTYTLTVTPKVHNWHVGAYSTTFKCGGWSNPGEGSL